MIDAGELRRLNWIGWKEPAYPIQVTEIADGDVNIVYSEGGGHSWCYDLENCVGIPLTPELLSKCGLVRGANNEYFIGRFNFRPVDDKWEVYIQGNDVRFHWITDLYFLHSLQNFIFPLTGKELTINL